MQDIKLFIDGDDESPTFRILQDQLNQLKLQIETQQNEINELKGEIELCDYTIRQLNGYNPDED